MSLNLVAAAKGASHLLLKRYLGPFWIRRRWLDKTQWLGAAELRELQEGLLQRMVRHCYDTVPFYRRLMDERSIRPSDIRTLEDLERFPVLTKRDVIQAGQSIVSKKYPTPLLRSTVTGGTTGASLRIWRDPLSISNEHAFVRRQFDWAHVGLRDRVAYLSWRVVLDPGAARGPLFAYDPFMRELILSTYHLSEKTAWQYLDAIKRYRVRALAGYPSAIGLLAEICGEAAKELELAAILTTSETLSDSVRNSISAAFGCKVFDYYGAAERVCYIHTCEHGSYHVLPEYGYTEFLPEGSLGEGAYRVVATGFWNRAMPLIRYDIGDAVSLADGACPCGRAFPRVRCVLGRSGDVVRTPSGRTLGPTLMVRATKGVRNVLETQVVQETLNHVTIRYVAAAGFSSEDLTHLQKQVAHYLGDELEIEYRQVETIERTRSGKHRFIVSQIGEPQNSHA